MNTNARLRVFLPMLAAALAVIVAPADAQEKKDKKTGWADSAELSFVVTGGNSETEAFGFKNKLTRTWENAFFQLNAGGIRVESTTKHLLVPNPNSTNFSEEELTDLTAENYHLNGRYDRDITPVFFWNAGAGWERNEFAGVKNRYIVSAGIGNNWVSTDKLNWRTSYAATFTDQDDLIPDPEREDTFLGARLTSDFKIKIGKTSAYENVLVIDFNLDESDDWRADWNHSVSVSMTSNLALKVNLQLLYDNLPSSGEFELFSGSSAPGAPTGNKILLELDELDTIFTASLVINF